MTVAPAEVAAPLRDPTVAPSSASAYEAMMGFASATLRQNLETSARLARCKSPMEVLAAQTAHAAALTQSFIATSLKLMQSGFSSAPWTLPKARNEHH
ncbi:MAG: phasin family protein [Stellaceae bacterium]